MNRIEKIASQLLSSRKRTFASLSLLEGGLIHSTYHLVDNQNDSYVMQAINTAIFTDPELVQKNIRTVNQYLSVLDFPYKIAVFLSVDENRDFLQIDSQVWRLGIYYTDTDCFNQIPDTRYLRNAVIALADFHRCMNRADSPRLASPIPGFLDFNARRNTFLSALESGMTDRISQAEEIIQQLQQHLHLVDEYSQLAEKLGESVIHGDPKLSNFLFAAQSPEVAALIDLDTVQTGSILYDVGDLIRSTVNIFPEDEDLSRLADGAALVHKEYFDLIIENYLLRMNFPPEFIGKSELALAAETVIFVQAMRFLTDYLRGDRYYRTSYPNHNLVRAKNQFKLSQEIQYLKAASR